MVTARLGAGAALLGHPAAVIAKLANHLGARGDVPLCGGSTETAAVRACARSACEGRASGGLPRLVGMR
jgi:2-keto-4-pentenoate hydratase